MNILEAIHYAQGDPHDLDLIQQVQAIYTRLIETCPFKIEYRIFPLDDSLHFASIQLTGRLAHAMLGSCSKIVVLVCTLGFPFEQELKRLSVRDPKKALLWDACGSAYIEECLDVWEKEKQIQWRPYFATDRFSCGYGDLPLLLQPALLDLVNARQKLGVHTLNSHMMFPTKSVSALIGLSETVQPAKIKGCMACLLNRNCLYKTKGRTCYERKSEDPRWSDGNDAPKSGGADPSDS